MAEQPKTPEEFDDYMDGLTIRERNSVLGVNVDAYKKKGESYDKFNAKLKRIVLRLVWALAWAWQVFTFGWPSALLIKWLDREFRRDKEE